MINREKVIIGRTAIARFPANGSGDVPVKIDTGADRSSVWASRITVDSEGTLSYVLFDEESPYYTGVTHSTTEYTAAVIRSSNGTAQVRYKVAMDIELEGRVIRASFTLADRSRNTYPVLIGCTLLRNKFIVDVALESPIQPAEKNPLRQSSYQKELHKDPHAFFKKYHKHNRRGDVEL